MFLYSVCIQTVGLFRALYTLPPGRPVHSGTNLTSLGNILATQDYSLIFPPLPIAMYSLIQLSEQGHSGENENSQTSKR